MTLLTGADVDSFCKRVGGGGKQPASGEKERAHQGCVWMRAWEQREQKKWDAAGCLRHTDDEVGAAVPCLCVIASSNEVQILERRSGFFVLWRGLHTRYFANLHSTFLVVIDWLFQRHGTGVAWMYSSRFASHRSGRRTTSEYVQTVLLKSVKPRVTTTTTTTTTASGKEKPALPRLRRTNRKKRRRMTIYYINPCEHF